MNLRDLGIVYRKELRDLLRDRRTIISMIVGPVIIIPLITIGMGTMVARQVNKTMAETSHAMILGGEDSPKTVAALKQLDNFDFTPASPDYAQQISEKKIGAAVEIPPGFDAALAAGTPATVKIYDYENEIKSETATNGLRGFFQELRAKTVEERLAQRNLPANLIKPFDVQTANVAPPQKVTGNMLGSIVAYVVLMTCLTASMYPAIDLTAGEKERGTMETLLCAPVSRIYLALGKCLVVLTVSLTTMLLMFLSGGVSLAMAVNNGRSLLEQSGLSLSMSLPSLAGVFVVMMPMALFFASALVAIGLFARSMKEAQSYVQPLMILLILPMMVSLLPGYELDYTTALIPVVNVSLLSKEILSGTYHWNFIVEIFASSCVYAGAALAIAVAMFKRENVVFRAM